MRTWPTADNVVMGCNKWWATRYFEDEEVKLYEAKRFTKFPQLLKELDICSSSEATRNGWNKEIPYGFSYHQYGQHHIWILNVDMSWWELFKLKYL